MKRFTYIRNTYKRIKEFENAAYQGILMTDVFYFLKV